MACFLQSVSECLVKMRVGVRYACGRSIKKLGGMMMRHNQRLACSAALLVMIASGPAARALTITPSYDNTITPSMQTAITSAISTLEGLYTNNVNITVDF